MKTILIALLLIITVSSCKKEYSAEKTDVPALIVSLPLADTSLIGDTTVYYDCVFGGSREFSISPKGPCTTLLSNWIGFAYDFTSSTFGYSCVFSKTDSLNSTRLNIQFRCKDFLPGDTSFYLRRQKALLALSPEASFKYESDLSLASSVIISRYDDAGNLWSSNVGTADQTGSFFRIVKQLDVGHGIYFQCKFECTLYNNKGDSIKLTNGRMGTQLWL